MVVFPVLPFLSEQTDWSLIIVPVVCSPFVRRFGSHCSVPGCFVGPGTRTSLQFLFIAAADGVHVYYCHDCALPNCGLPDSGVSIDPTYLLLTEGENVTYSVSLLTPPLPGTIVTVAPSVLSVSPLSVNAPTLAISPSLVFTPDNWTDVGSVMISVPSYPTFIGDFVFTLANSVTAPGDPLFDALSAARVLVQFVDTKSPSPSPAPSVSPTSSSSYSASFSSSSSYSPSFSSSTSLSSSGTKSSTGSPSPGSSLSITPTVSGSTSFTKSPSHSHSSNPSDTSSPTPSLSLGASPSSCPSLSGSATPHPSLSGAPNINIGESITFCVCIRVWCSWKQVMIESS